MQGVRDALHGLHAAWLSIPQGQRHRYGGVTGLCARPDGVIVGDRYPRDVLRRVAVIKAAQRVGIPLDEIRSALGALPSGRTPTTC